MTRPLYQRPSRDEIARHLGIAPELVPEPAAVVPEPALAPVAPEPRDDPPGRLPVHARCGYRYDALGHIWTCRRHRW